MTPLTVIIPAHNEEGCIGQAIDNVEKLDLPFRLIVVNDCSTDRTEEAIREKIQGELLHLFAPAEVKRVFRDDIMMLKSKLIKIEHRTAILEVNENYYPPCIKNLISAAKSGANIPHVGRFTLVAFLNEIGMETEDILGVFAASPDFNKEKSRYQVEHISGKASSTTYTTPKCDTLLTWGLCCPDDLCKTVHHPLSYYRRRSRR